MRLTRGLALALLWIGCLPAEGSGQVVMLRQPNQSDAGILVAHHERHGESFVGNSPAVGAWASVGTRRKRINIDVATSRWTEEGRACLDSLCARSTPSTHRERNLVVG